MQYLEAYHLSSEMTQAERDERNRMDCTCFACGFVDDKCNGHECPGYPEDRK